MPSLHSFTILGWEAEKAARINKLVTHFDLKGNYDKNNHGRGR
jgi:hypothetical protein